MTTEPLYWHFLAADSRTTHTNKLVEVGKTYRIEDEPVLCKRGLHASALALAIWQEQLDYGIGEPGEVASEDRLGDWLGNRVYGLDVLEAAADGDVESLVRVRYEAGLPPFS